MSVNTEILAGKSERERPLEETKLKRKDNIQINIKGTRCACVGWTYWFYRRRDFLEALCIYYLLGMDCSMELNRSYLLRALISNKQACLVFLAIFSVAPENLMVIWNKVVVTCSHIRPLQLRTTQPLSG
jgi:hypothetical protein